MSSVTITLLVPHGRSWSAWTRQAEGGSNFGGWKITARSSSGTSLGKEPRGKSQRMNMGEHKGGREMPCDPEDTPWCPAASTGAGVCKTATSRQSAQGNGAMRISNQAGITTGRVTGCRRAAGEVTAPSGCLQEPAVSEEGINLPGRTCLRGESLRDRWHGAALLAPGATGARCPPTSAGTWT